LQLFGLLFFFSLAFLFLQKFLSIFLGFLAEIFKLLLLLSLFFCCLLLLDDREHFCCLGHCQLIMDGNMRLSELTEGGR
jgi:hypothetical protein